MAKISKYTRAKNWADGMKAERLFVSTMEKRGATVKKTTQKQDMYDHIDYFVNGHSVDVKSKRYLDMIWLEITNVRGDDGWLKGEAEFIAFHFPNEDCFMVFRRDELLLFVQENVVDTTNTSPPEYLKWYTRSKFERYDLITKVKYDHIKHLNHTIINCEKLVD